MLIISSTVIFLKDNLESESNTVHRDKVIPCQLPEQQKTTQTCKLDLPDQLPLPVLLVATSMTKKSVSDKWYCAHKAWKQKQSYHILDSNPETEATHKRVKVSHVFLEN